MITRRGLSLLEVVLAIAILGMSLATIGQLIRIGARNAVMARDLATAQMYAESTLADVAAGQVTVPAAWTQFQFDGAVALTNAVPAGSVSTTLTAEASLGPPLVTSMV